jgi:mannose-6-phosphate isomerase-like protein (cupin superfamily)
MENIIKGNKLTEFYTSERCFITEILNADKFGEFSLAQARVEPGVTTELHTLKDTDELYYILSGQGEMEVGGNKLGMVTEKDAVLIPKNTTQRITNKGTKDLVFLCICSPRFNPGIYQSSK